MAIVITDDKNYTAIAEAIRATSFGELEETMLPSEMADNISQVAEMSFNIGYSDGEMTGYEEGFDEGVSEGRLFGIEEGTQAEHDRFWEAYQENGNRTDYGCAFAGLGWNDETFKPKYDIRPVINGGATHIFRKAKIKNLSELLEERGVVLDLSQCVGDVSEPFSNCTSLTHVPTIDLSSASKLTHGFSYSTALVSIEKLIVHEGLTYGYPVQGCTALVDLIVEGVIGQNGFSVQQSPKLSKTSIESIINALSTTTSGLSITLSKTAINAAFTDEEWATLANTRSNWTINLV